MALRAKQYFADYDVETRLENGRTVRRYVYKGDLYARQLSAGARARERAAYPLLALLAAGLLLFAMRRPVAPNLGGVFASLSLLALIPAFCVLEGAAEAFFRKGDLKKEDYRERLVMLRVMPVVGAGLNLLLAGSYLYDALAKGGDAAACLSAAGCTLAAAAAYAGLAVREIRVGYRVIPGERSLGPTPAPAAAPAPEEEDGGDA